MTAEQDVPMTERQRYWGEEREWDEEEEVLAEQERSRESRESREKESASRREEGLGGGCGGCGHSSFVFTGRQDDSCFSLSCADDDAASSRGSKDGNECSNSQTLVSVIDHPFNRQHDVLRSPILPSLQLHPSSHP